MPEHQYNPGQKVQLFARFTVLKVLTDPTTAEMKVKDPTGTITSYFSGGALVHESAGVYRLELTPSIPGRWWYKGIGTDACEATDENSFIVRDHTIT